MVVTLTKSVLWPGLNYFQIMQKVTGGVKPNTLGIRTDTLGIESDNLRKLCDLCFNPVQSRPSMNTVLYELHAIVYH